MRSIRGRPAGRPRRRAADRGPGASQLNVCRRRSARLRADSPARARVPVIRIGAREAASRHPGSARYRAGRRSCGGCGRRLLPSRCHGPGTAEGAEGHRPLADDERGHPQTPTRSPAVLTAAVAVTPLVGYRVRLLGDIAHHVAFVLGILALASAALRVAARIAPAGLERALVAVVLGVAAAITTALALGLAGLGTNPVALTLAAVAVWAAARAPLPRPVGAAWTELALWWADLGTPLKMAVGALAACCAAWLAWQLRFPVDRLRQRGVPLPGRGRLDRQRPARARNSS